MEGNRRTRRYGEGEGDGSEAGAGAEAEAEATEAEADESGPARLTLRQTTVFRKSEPGP